MSMRMLKFYINFVFTKITMVDLCLCQIVSQFGGPKFWIEFFVKLSIFTHFVPSNEHENF